MNKEKVLLSQEEVKEIRNKKPTEVAGIKAQDFGDSVSIDFESNGRFYAPSVLHFKDYSTRDITKLSTSSEDDLLETVINIIQGCKMEDNYFNIEDCLVSEFYEILIGMKIAYQSKNHTHYWVCSKCSNNQDDPKINESIIDLTKLNFRNVSEIDEMIVKERTNFLKTCSHSEFKGFLEAKYQNEDIDISKITIEDEVEKAKDLKLKSIFRYKSVSNGNIYEFRYPTIGDILKASKKAKMKYSQKIKLASKRSYVGVSETEKAFKREEEVKRLQKLQNEELIIATRALCLISKNGENLNDDEKIKEWGDNFSRKDVENVTNFFEKTEVGLFHKEEFICPECGEVNKEYLQHESIYLEFLPIKSDTKRKARSSNGHNFFMD